MRSNSEEKGMVLRIERTSIHDGDGLRTVVFMKGCPLRCWWCSTPESQHIEVEKGYLDNRCIGCSICIESCPQGALSLSLEKKVVIDKVKCNMCFTCFKKCPYNAYKKYGNLMSVDELVHEIAKDEIFYFHSGGGVTFSGGDPLNQFKFVAETMKKCKRSGIHTAIESSLFAPYENIEEILPWLDVLYVDIKHMGKEEHKRYTGVDNNIILENILKIDCSTYPVNIYVRIPLTPSVNDTKENLLNTIEFCSNLKKLKEIELLPYHRLGIETYKNLGIEYKLSNISSPTPERMLELVDFMSANSQGIRVRTGGGFTKK